MEIVLDVLHERGFIQEVTEEPELRQRLQQPVSFYHGIDATNRSLHIGNFVSCMMLNWFQRFGHQPIALLGGGTSLIGDPSGKTSSRPILSEEEIEGNVQAIKAQLARFIYFGAGKALLVNNADWLTRLNFVDFMRDIGSRFSVNEVLRLEAYRTRLEAGGLSFLEFSYVLMQSYDFLELYRRHDCILQIGGSDQWGNSIAGADLVRKVTGGQAFVLVSPLILTGSGTKMGKSERGAVWLDPDMTSPYDFYQYWRNTDDVRVETSLAVFTFLPMDEVRRLGALQDAELNRAKEVLAFEVTKMVHGEEEARKAQAAAHTLFGGVSFEGALTTELIPTVVVDAAQLAEGFWATDLFKKAGLVVSANEARNLILQGGLSVNERAVAHARERIDDGALKDGCMMLSRGRKRHVRVKRANEQDAEA